MFYNDGAKGAKCEKEVLDRLKAAKIPFGETVTMSIVCISVPSVDVGTAQQIILKAVKSNGVRVFNRAQAQFR